MFPFEYHSIKSCPQPRQAFSSRLQREVELIMVGVSQESPYGSLSGTDFAGRSSLKEKLKRYLSSVAFDCLCFGFPLLWFLSE